jgi:hypothetical protein
MSHPSEKKASQITEVKARMPITSVNVAPLPEKAGQDYGSKRKNPVYFRNSTPPHPAPIDVYRI